jgi:hypothetical protein
MDCFVASLLAMTAHSLNVVPAHAGTHTPRFIVEGCCWTTFTQHNVLWLWVPAFAGTTTEWCITNTHPRSRDAKRPRFAAKIPPSPQRAQGMPGAWCARSRVCDGRKQKAHALVRSHRNTRHSPRNGFTVSFVLSPVIGLFCHRHPRKLLSADLTPASRRQDHTTSPSTSGALVRSAIRVHRIPPHACDDRETPLWEAGQRDYRFDLGLARKEIFFACDLDTPNHVDPPRQISF